MTQEALEREEDVLRRLQSDEPLEVRQAAFEAGDLRLQSAVQSLVNHFANSSVGVQEAAEQALRKIRGAATVRAMTPLLRSEIVVVRNIAMDVLREVGVDDITTLTALLHDDDVDIRIFVSDILGSTKSPLALTPLCEALLRDPEVNVRYQAAVSLGELRNPAAAECLRQAVNDEEWVQYAVMEALAKIKDGSCVDVLLQALETSSPLVASTVLDALGDINNVKAAPALLAYLDKTEGPLRTKALKAVIQILGGNALTLLGGKQFGMLQSHMLSALDEEDEETQIVVLQGLASTGVNPEATRAVLALAARTDPDTQQELLQQEFLTLVGIGYNEALEEALTGDNELARRMALDACSQIPGRAGKYALKRHFDALRVEDRQHAMELLAQSGDDRDIPFFEHRLTPDEDPQVLRSALHFLGVHMRHVESAPRLLALLDHPVLEVKEAALAACMALEDEETVHAIAARAGDEDPAMRRMAVYAMGAAGAEFFAAELAQAVQDPAAEVRKTALEAIGYGWPPSADKLAALEYCLGDESREVRLIAVEQLGAFPGEDVAHLLIAALKDQDDWVRVRAVEALGHNRTPQAVSPLISLMETSNLLVRLKLVEALGHIGGDVAFRALLGYMANEEPDVQAAAAEAVAQIRSGSGMQTTAGATAEAGYGAGRAADE